MQRAQPSAEPLRTSSELLMSRGCNASKSWLKHNRCPALHSLNRTNGLGFWSTWTGRRRKPQESSTVRLQGLWFPYRDLLHKRRVCEGRTPAIPAAFGFMWGDRNRGTPQIGFGFLWAKGVLPLVSARNSPKGCRIETPV